MFTIVVDHRKRRAWSARTVAVSIGAHLLVLTGIVVTATNTRAAQPTVLVDIGQYPPATDPPAPPRPAPPPRADQPKPVPGKTLELRTPDRVPEHVLPPKPNEPPVDPNDYTGIGPVGNVTVMPEPTPEPQPPARHADPPLPDFRTDVIPAEDADILPQLLSSRDVQRMLERVYPGMLRDTGVTGRTTVLLVIDRTGAVEPGSITVQETSHDAFREAAVRAAERFRFRPARLNGQPVAVSIALPIEWKIQR